MLSKQPDKGLATSASLNAAVRMLNYDLQTYKKVVRKIIDSLSDDDEHFYTAIGQAFDYIQNKRSLWSSNPEENESSQGNQSQATR